MSDALLRGIRTFRKGTSYLGRLQIVDFQTARSWATASSRNFRLQIFFCGFVISITHCLLTGILGEFPMSIMTTFWRMKMNHFMTKPNNRPRMSRSALSCLLTERPLMKRFVGAVVLVALCESVIVAKEMVPFKGEGSGEGFVDFVNPDPDCESLLTIRATQHGQATQLGNYTAASIPCLNPLDGSFFGKATSTSANGDELYTTYVGQFQPDPVPGMPGATLVLATVTIDGGTGRFENATGSYDYREMIFGGGATFEFEGKISAVGSANSAHAIPEPTSMSLAWACFFGFGTYVRRHAKKRI